ncbi:ferric reduction oxidase 6 [Striga asiatica]|uniref:Ferric reduction oxidase 6 n=1 Tax=Striga asiatica TaxID=4170 RepID=A0A5A7Q1M6_STRAF|nr:ferric reduction oxidase 6 [Striga asiatica]
MDEKSSQKAPLLSRKADDVTTYPKKKPFLLSSAKWALRVLMWAVFIAWMASTFLYPSDSFNTSYLKLARFTEGTLFGIAGTIFLTYSAPVILIAFLATAYLALRGKEDFHVNKNSNYARFRLWTFPVLVDGPFGVVSAAELFWIFIVTAYLLWAFVAFTVKNREILSLFQLPTKEWRYENLILVAGGIGISPFLAILSDVLHRINDGKPCRPKNILIIWAIKTEDELPLLNTVDMNSICPTFSQMLNLEIQTYVTRQSEPTLEQGKAIEPVSSTVFPANKKNGMSVLVGTGNIIWSGMYVIVSTLGLGINVALLNVFYVNPYGVEYLWYKGLLFIACMVVSVLVFGGLVIVLWHLWEKRTSDYDFEETTENGFVQPNEPKMEKSSNGKEQCVTTIRYGIFESMSDRLGNADIGVILCGPPALQTSVAKECRKQNLRRRGNQAMFHFNSHSFDLTNGIPQATSNKNNLFPQNQVKQLQEKTQLRLPGSRRRRRCREHWRHSRKDGILVNSNTRLPRKGHEGRHKARIASQRGLRVIVVSSNILEPIMPVGPRHHGPHQGVWVGLLRVSPPPPPFAVVPYLILRNRGPPVVHVLRIMVPEPHHIAHLPRILTQDVLHLRREVGPTVPSGSVGGFHVVAEHRGQEGRVHHVLKRLRGPVIQLDHATCQVIHDDDSKLIVPTQYPVKRASPESTSMPSKTWSCSKLKIGRVTRSIIQPSCTPNKLVPITRRIIKHGRLIAHTVPSTLFPGKFKEGLGTMDKLL